MLWETAPMVMAHTVKVEFYQLEYMCCEVSIKF
jgi:hypothetical protein